MVSRNSWLVIPDDRPGGKKKCFYCGSLVGSQHVKGCVCRTRTIVVDFTIRMIREVPEDWNEELIEFSINESSWCASNLIEEFEKVTEQECLCSRTSGEFIREATEEDELELIYKRK